MRKLGRFLWQYRIFSGVVVAALVALGLDLNGYDTAAHWILGVVSVGAALPLLKDMWDDLHSGSYGIDILAITAIAASVLLHEYWAAIVIVIMLTGGEALEDYAERRAKSELDALLTKAPQRATVLRGRKQQEIPASQVQVGDKLIIKPGEVVPVDAVILEGGGDFDEAALTGESLPVSKQSGDELLSGAINVDGAITARCLRSAKNSQYEQIIKLVRAASNSQAPFVRLADRYSIPFTIVAYAIAITVWVLSGDPVRFLEVIVVATPCPLLLAAPIAIISGMSRSAKHGIIVKTGGALERLAEAETIAFDKTGTLTSGILKVKEVRAIGVFDERTVLTAAASLEQQSNHVLAQATLDEAASRGYKLGKIKQLKETAGQGLHGRFGGKEALVGRLSFLKERGVSIPRNLASLQSNATTMYVALDNELAGMVSFTDSIRPESKATVDELRQLKYSHLLLVTGDNNANASAVAKAVGIKAESVTAEALPADKLHVIEALEKRPVVFVGDGVNDAPVLTAADVGIALGARGSTAASESADVVIMTDNLQQVAVAARIAKRTFTIATQSILIGIVISVGLMALFATGKFTALTGAILQEVVDVVVIFNALRAHSAGRAFKAAKAAAKA